MSDPERFYTLSCPFIYFLNVMSQPELSEKKSRRICAFLFFVHVRYVPECRDATKPRLYIQVEDAKTVLPGCPQFGDNSYICFYSAASCCFSGKDCSAPACGDGAGR